MNFKIVFIILITLTLSSESGFSQPFQELRLPEQDGIWIRPANDGPAQAIWGFENGIRVGLAPMLGPRGLLRIYAPYLGHKDDKMINFIALEPVVAGQDQRGFSELEKSTLDGVQGKRFWSSNDSLITDPLPVEFPARGVIEGTGGTSGERAETLTVFIFSEPFDNGAKVYVRLRFFEDRPYEVELTAYARKDSKELDYFILTATMGNFARLRTLCLNDSTKSSLELWPDYTDDHFTGHDITAIDAMIKDQSGAAYFIAAPDEVKPQNAIYAPDTNNHWKYYGKIATQYWYCPEPTSELTGLVNGRYTYWASQSPIPGGISFENFEFKEPFRHGAIYVFGVSPVGPDEFIERVTGN
jgi:hypothetical protein